MEKDIEKEILEKDKTKKYRILVLMLCSLIGLLAITTIILSIIVANKNEQLYPEKIGINIVNTDYYEPNDQVKGKYGLDFFIVFDAKKHPKYDEWVKKYDIGDNYETEDYIKLNKAFYESIKYLFLDLECLTSDWRYVKFYYSINEDTEETIEGARKKIVEIKNSFFDSFYYKNCVQLSKEEYIKAITVCIYLPTSIEE